jgi:hypothetical protein
MNNKMIKRIAIGLISLIIIALIGLNIYEYMKVIHPSKTINPSESINFKTEFGSAQAKKNSNTATAANANNDLSRE